MLDFSRNLEFYDISFLDEPLNGYIHISFSLYDVFNNTYIMYSVAINESDPTKNSIVVSDMKPKDFVETKELMDRLGNYYSAELEILSGDQPMADEIIVSFMDAYFPQYTNTVISLLEQEQTNIFLRKLN